MRRFVSVTDLTYENDSTCVERNVYGIDQEVRLRYVVQQPPSSPTGMPSRRAVSQASSSFAAESLGATTLDLQIVATTNQQFLI